VKEVDEMEKLYDGMLLEKDGQKMLKAYLEIKRQLDYCQKNADEAIYRYNNKEAHNSWMGMVEAYSIALQILEGKEL
jgi:hypothetical protein